MGRIHPTSETIEINQQFIYHRPDDSLLNDCLLTFIEQDIFLEMEEDDITKTLMSLRRRRLKKSGK